MWKKSIQSPCIHQFFYRCNKVVVLVIKLLTSSESRGSFFTLSVEWLISGKWSIRWVLLFNKGLFLSFLFSLLFSFSHWFLCIGIKGRQQGLTSQAFPVLYEADPAHRSGPNSTGVWIGAWLETWLSPTRLDFSFSCDDGFTVAGINMLLVASTNLFFFLLECTQH